MTRRYIPHTLYDSTASCSVSYVVIPCENDRRSSPIAVGVACAARKHGIYQALVRNLLTWARHSGRAFLRQRLLRLEPIFLSSTGQRTPRGSALVRHGFLAGGREQPPNHSTNQRSLRVVQHQHVSPGVRRESLALH